MISQRRIRIAALVVLANAAVALQFLPSAQACVDECEKPKFLCMPLNECLQMPLSEKYSRCKQTAMPSCFTKCAFDCTASAPKGGCKGLPALQCNYKSTLPAACPADPCGSSLTLVTQTQATVPANRARTKLGVGESVNLSLTPAPACPVVWQIIAGNGSLNFLSGVSNVYTAHERAQTATVRATVNGFTYDKTYNVWEPASETAVETCDNTSIPPGTQGVIMDLTTTVHPTDVSFARVEIKELPGPATNVTGYWQNVPEDLCHCGEAINPDFFGLDANNSAPDVAALFGAPPPWTPTPASFQWDIPVRWRVIGSINEASLPNRLQTFTLNNSTGSTTVWKLDRSCERTP